MASNADPTLVAAIQAEVDKHAKTMVTGRIKAEMLQIAQETRDAIRTQIDRFVERNDVLSATLRAYLSQEETDTAMNEMRVEALDTVWVAVSGTLLAAHLGLAREGPTREGPAQQGPAQEGPVQEGPVREKEGPLGPVFPTPY